MLNFEDALNILDLNNDPDLLEQLLRWERIPGSTYRHGRWYINEPSIFKIVEKLDVIKTLGR